jgi:hypothetical protein
MAVTLNASTSSGLVQTADTSGVLTLQSNGTDAASVSGSNFQFNSGYGSVATAYGCRAWVNFNGTGTVAIRASGNVTSITDNGTGLYTVNFTTAMPDSSYSVPVGGSQDGFSSTANYGIGVYGYSTSSVSIACRTEANAYADFQFINAAVLR